MTDHMDTARFCLAPLRDKIGKPEYDEVLRRVAEQMQENFDLGFRAAGGTITPLDMVELRRVGKELLDTQPEKRDQLPLGLEAKP